MKVNIERLTDPNKESENKNLLRDKTEQIMRLNNTNQEIWDNLTEVTKTSAKNILGNKEGVLKQQNADIIYLFKLQKHPNTHKQSTKDENQREQLTMHRNHILTDIHATLRHLENQRIQNATKEIETTRDCNHKMYEAVKNINRLKPQQLLLIKNDHGLTSNEKE